MELGSNYLNIIFIIILIGMLFLMKKSGGGCCSKNGNKLSRENESKSPTVEDLQRKIERIERQNQLLQNEVNDLKHK
ncbi:hypothetical protein H1D32_08125 [Anaerobacillus sp. CMMVII]|uniref:hypothetical protein n=1 Tax=Anaerobacillus sp. CMMVII TaxID=2755588 RepID=UPI0021B78EE4|nr:hypothetical protein [Anaerobacillus sp. CMMVII]MCT8137728.1 hypothetical protein [Anaerobacillus sp. CMMVII]